MFNRAGYDLTILPSAFTRVIQGALGPLNEDVCSWLDDILIASATWEEHLQTLSVVLSRLLAAGLSVNFAKCVFGAASQEFLGMVIASSGLRPAPSKLEAITKMPQPKNVEELRSFLGMTSYLRQFVKKYSIIAAPLTDLLRSKDFASKKARKLPIPWGTPQEESFQNLKQELASPLVLAFPDWNIPYILQTDANTVGADAVLIQSMRDEEGIISCASHRFSRTDSLRGPTQRECMAVLWAIKHFSQNVADRRFTLVTDCSALTWLFRSRNLDPKLHRWALCLQKYEIELKWRAGCTHLVPDCLLRLPTTKPLLEDVDDSFRDDTSSLSSPNLSTPTRPVFEGVALQDLAPYEISTTHRHWNNSKPFHQRQQK